MLRTVAGRRTGESAEDLHAFLDTLQGCPEVTRTVLARCAAPVHDEEPASWFYVEADPVAGVARRRCLACGHTSALLDSEQRWTYPPTWSCWNCGHSIAEVGFGLHVTGGVEVTWIAMGVRCVECGTVTGVADVVVPAAPVDAVLAAL